MKPSNFPGRKQRRELRAEMPVGQKTEPTVDAGVRNKRTKKSRKDRVGK